MLETTPTASPTTPAPVTPTPAPVETPVAAPVTPAPTPATPPPPPASSTSTDPEPALPATPAPGSGGFPKFGIMLALFIGLVALAIGALAYYMGWLDGGAMTELEPSPTPTEMMVSPSPAEEATVCTMDAMLCPDGSYVGRTGPNCEFVCADGTSPESTASPVPPGSPSAEGAVDLDVQVPITY